MKSPKTNYFTYTKDNFIGILFIFPFLLVYEMLFYIVYADNDLKARNLAEILIRDFFSLFGSFGFLVEIIFLISILYYLIKRKDFLFDEAIEYLIKIRPCVNINVTFLNEVKSLLKI